MIREIVKDIKALQQSCKTVRKVRDIQDVITDLIDTAQAYAGEENGNCVGLAANQIGYDQRVIVGQLSMRVGSGVKTGWVVMINPVIVDHSKTTYMSEEGCLSLEGTRTVKRWEKVKVMYKDTRNKMNTIIVSGFQAAIVQHEIDHLNGKLI